jgi:hypothetical protein
MFSIPKNSNEIQIDLPTFAVDISGAYTSGAQGTGFASLGPGVEDNSADITQNEAIDRIASLLHSLKENTPGVNLIIEAPLSYAMATSGSSNALLREIEKPASYPKLTLAANRVRPWNSNAGASTALMALIFLTDLQARAPKGVTINLFEGFWTWLRKPDKHARVAMDLLEGFRAGGKRVVWITSKNVHYRTALDLLKIGSPDASIPPPVVFGHEDLANAYAPQD